MDMIDEVDEIMSENQSSKDAKPKLENEVEEENDLMKEVRFYAAKQYMIEKIAHSLYRTEYTYLEFLSHIFTECEEHQMVDTGCPLEKCKERGKLMNLNDLKAHLKNDCTKVTLECNVC